MRRQRKLRELSRAFRKLRFQPVMDFTILHAGSMAPNGFARLLYNKPDGCYAEIGAAEQILRARKEFYISVTSFLDRGWSLGSTNLPRTATDRVLRLPRALCQYMPGARPHQLLDWHLKRRAHLLRSLRVRLYSDVGCQEYFARVKRRIRQRRAAVSKRRVLVEFMAEEPLLGRGKSEWLGEYAERMIRQWEKKNLPRIAKALPGFKISKATL